MYLAVQICDAMLFENKTKRTGSGLNEILSVLGVVFLGLALLLSGDVNLFPGWKAVLPVTGATLFIAAGPDAWINRVLFSNKPAVCIGLVSYPFYLWHWPLIS
ncbi:MAG: hypothetical protein LBN96_09285 [Desulfovibrio sp.]|jgi:peptidoglycan/LPS O-acetylase OafA/YrhL|nr:hypothetical protein [Desulfovibrio sp.]